MSEQRSMANVLPGQPAVNFEEELLAILDRMHGGGALPTWQEAYNSPLKVKCDCAVPHVQRSGIQAMGLVLDIDLCCLAREVEKLTGKKFRYLTVTRPAFCWDSKELVDDKQQGTKRPRGLPVQWMRERFGKFRIPWR